jgi:hypothetical protein
MVLIYWGENIIYSEEKYRSFLRPIKRNGAEVNATDT